MKLVAGSILTVTSSVFYLARIQAQAINFDSAFKLASRCSLGLFLAGEAGDDPQLHMEEVRVGVRSRFVSDLDPDAAFALVHRQRRFRAGFGAHGSPIGARESC